MIYAAIGVGANLGDGQATLRQACGELAELPHSRWVATSHVYRSKPVQAAGPDFFNAVALIDTLLSPLQLLEALQALEHAHGRQRPYRNAPRTLDLDLLLYGDHRLIHRRLRVPHARLTERAFVLLPLLELMPSLRLSGTDDLIATAQVLADQQGIERLDGMPFDPLR